MKFIKITKSFVLILLSVIITASVIPANAVTFKSIKKNYDFSYGIDVSKWNGTLNWSKIKNAGVEFMYIRVGWYDDEGGHLDEKFKENVKNCVENGIEYGVYVYSYVYKNDDNTACAKWVDKQLNSLGNYCKDKDTIHVAYDIEDSTQKNAVNKKKITKSNLQKSVIKFCDHIRDKGYIPVVYSYEDFFETYLNISNFQENNIKIWFAQWPAANKLNTTKKKLMPNGTYADVWQFSSSHTIGDVVFDSNVCYEDFYDYNNEDSSLKISGLKSTYSFTGDSVNPTIKVYNGSTPLQKDVDYKVVYFRNDRAGKAKLKVIRYSDGEYLETKTFSYIIKPKTVTNVSTKSGSDYINITWNKSIGADSYQIFEYDKSSGSYDKIDTVTSNNYDNNWLSQGKNYKMRIRAVKTVDGKNYYSPYTSFSAYTKYKKVDIKSVKSKNKKTATVKWTPKTSKTKGYEIQYSTKKSFKNASVKKITSKSKSSVKIKKLKSKKKYYFRIRSYNTVNGKKIYSVYSKSLNVKIK